MNIKPIPLQVAKPIEQDNSWDGKSNPYQLALYIASICSVDPSAILKLQEIIYSPIAPSGDDKEKIWIKSEGAPAIGIPIGGTYQMFYQYPPNTPFIWTKGSTDLPTYLTKIANADLSDYGLTDPANSDYFYVQLIP